ncbi:MAG TPA: phosphoadenylyl-sulfate reductase [Candidatus Binataceae bacterium]|jgi:thioredoxin-dependent adenylylsulfate APS reductase|nr:phosphoadenylyl-sulfate reductase [Candidatus Binataceae bacterium]
MRAESEHILMDELEAGEAAVELDDKEPQEVLEWALERFGGRLGICSSFQAEGSALIDMAWRIDPGVRVFTIDTGRQPQETHDLIDAVRARYGVRVEVFAPDSGVVEAMVTRHGNNLFYRDVNLRLLCCQVRKVLPLRRALMNFDAWVTGLRRDQWATRSNIRKIEIDHDHGAIVKFAPLADWTEEEVWDYIRGHDVPYNALYDRGFRSIGCAPCTRAVAPGADPRSGRWWWESGAPKECGMHCAIETGGFEHELAALLGRDHAVAKDGAARNGANGHDGNAPAGEGGDG